LYVWHMEGRWDDGDNYGDNLAITYCTPHSRAELRALRGLPPEEPAPTLDEEIARQANPWTLIKSNQCDEVTALKARIAELEKERDEARTLLDNAHWSEEEDFLDRAALAALPAIIQEYRTGGLEQDLAGWSYNHARAMLQERRRVRGEIRKEGAK
jgi:hypothetical protein